MELAVVVILVLVGILVERQKRRHRATEKWEYDRLGREMPPLHPPPAVAECLLFVWAGLFALWIMFFVAVVVERPPGYPITARDLGMIAVLLGVGAGLVCTGVRNLWGRIRFRRSVKSNRSK